jgi:anti-sigma factor RsiW
MGQPMNCAEIERRLWEYLDSALPPEEAAAVRAHLGGCGGCGPVCRCCTEFLRLLRRAHRSQAGASEILRIRLRARISQEI